jgi:lysophospholipase L1-like esterase
VLSFTPLRLLGIISYGVYLWHWPVIVFLTPARAHVDGVALDVVRVVLVLAAATISYRLVELPVRHGVPVGRRLLAVGPAALAVSLGVTLVATSGTPRPVFSDIPDGPLAGTDTIFLHVPATASPGARRVLLVGDSGAQFLGPELVDVGTEEGLSVAFSSEVACTPVVPEGLTQRPNGTVDRQKVCGDHRRALWTRLVDEYDPDIVVYYLANAGGLSRIRLDGEWLFDCDAAYDAYIDRTLRADADLLSAGGATVVFTTSPYIAVLDGRSKDRTDCRNQLLRDLAASRPGTSVVDLNSFVLGEARAGHDMFVDSLHLSPEGGQLASRWLLPLIL